MATSPAQFLIVAIFCVVHVTAQCRFLHSDLETYQPLMLLDNGFRDVRRFVETDFYGYVTFKAGDNITLVCPGDYNYMTGDNIPVLQSLIATCKSSFNFIYNGLTFSLKSVECYSRPKYDIRTSIQTIGSCEPGEMVIDVGYNLPITPPTFLKMYDVCFDQNHLAALSTRHIVVRGQTKDRTTSMNAFLYEGIDPSKAYTNAAQTASFTRQLDATSAKKYINSTNYLVYRKLVPTNDLVFQTTTYTTLFYFNTVPFWRNSQTKFWTNLEESIRYLTVTEGDLQVHTDALGIMKLSDSEGIKKPIYLHSEDQMQAIPVPKYLRKRVVNSEGEEVIFVQVVHTSGVSSLIQAGAEEAEEAVCAEDVCAQLRWLPWAHVPAAQRNVICCHPQDALLHRRLPEHRRANVTARAAKAKGLLVGKGDRALYASFGALHS